MISYWERASFLCYNYIIVGGGIVGFSTAISLKEKYPKASILVLEAGFLPSGASTKNAGFACVGSLSEIVDDLQHHSIAEIQALTKLRFEGLNLLRLRLGDEKIEYQACKSNELLMLEEANLLTEISKINEILKPVFGENIFKENAKAKKDYGFGDEVQFLIENKVEGSIHTGKMMKQLILKAQSMGVEYKTNSKVTEVADNGHQVHVRILNFEERLQADKAFICTNAFAKQLLPHIDLKPGRGQVLVTEPIANLKLNGIFHFNGGYYYFREINGRILFGGGRNLDFETETSTDFELNNKIQSDLDEKLKTIICPGLNYKIAMRWTGIMAFGNSKKPVIENVSQNVIAGVRLGGMGVAIGSKLGEMLAAQIDA